MSWYIFFKSVLQMSIILLFVLGAMFVLFVLHEWFITLQDRYITWRFARNEKKDNNDLFANIEEFRNEFN